jgi:hypothetical protein
MLCGHVAPTGEIRSTYKIVRNLKEEPTWEIRHRWEVNIK